MSRNVWRTATASPPPTRLEPSERAEAVRRARVAVRQRDTEITRLRVAMAEQHAGFVRTVQAIRTAHDAALGALRGEIQERDEVIARYAALSRGGRGC